MSKLAVLAKLNDINASEHEECEKGFVRLSKAWYASSSLIGDLVEEFTIGFYAPDGGTTGEFALRFTDRGGGNPPFLRLEVHDDAFHALACMPELVVALARHDDYMGDEVRLTPDVVEALLLELGYTNRTRFKHPGAA